jgi:hypothetical protein
MTKTPLYQRSNHPVVDREVFRPCNLIWRFFLGFDLVFLSKRQEYESRKYFVFLFCTVIFVSTSNAQLKILLGPTIGLTTPTVDYSGETTDYYAGTNTACVQE